MSASMSFFIIMYYGTKIQECERFFEEDPMKVRERMLPPGWYPDEKEEVLEEIAGWKRLERRLPTPAVACIVPHAGWYFSVELAFMGIREPPSRWRRSWPWRGNVTLERPLDCDWRASFVPIKIESSTSAES